MLNSMKPKRHGEPWTDEELRDLRDMILDGLCRTDMAEFMERSLSSVDTKASEIRNGCFRKRGIIC